MNVWLLGQYLPQKMSEEVSVFWKSLRNIGAIFSLSV